MRSPLFIASAAFFAVLTVAGCKCERALNKKSPELHLSSKSLDFGTVQVNLEHPGTIKVRNDGSASLTLSDPEVAAPFGVQTEIPLTIEIGGEVDLVLTYKPTVANQVDTGEITFHTDDPANVTTTISLRGQGITAVATVTPNPIAFGDVYVGESKSVTVNLRNSGSNELTVQDVAFDSAPSFLTGDLSPLKANVPAGSDVQTSLVFTPPAITDLNANLAFNFDPLQGGLVTVPITGRGVQAQPRLCFRFEGAGTETCSPFDPTQASGSITIPFGKLCDNTITPPGTDGGCTDQTGTRRGTLYIRNEGNVPVKFSGSWKQNAIPKTCDGGFDLPDFQFSNAPDAGVNSFTTPTAQLPAMVNDPKPWETAPVTVTYSAHSRCVDQTSDSANVTLVRQGDPLGRNPTLLLVAFSGDSLLPNAQPSDVSKTVARTQLPTDMPFKGVVNQGDAPFSVTKVTLVEEVFDAGAGTGPNGGVLVPCAGAAPGSACSQFSFSTDGGDPNLRTPITIPAFDGGVGPTIGQLVFGVLEADGGTNCATGLCPGRNYVIYGVVENSDPYHPVVVSKISAVAQ